MSYRRVLGNDLGVGSECLAHALAATRFIA
jgi:hypothetical protein